MLERLTYDRHAKTVMYRSDNSDGPTAGTKTADPLEFLALVLVHIPDQGHVTTRYYGWYANRPRGMRVKAKPAAADHRGLPPRESDVERRDADRRMHHSGGGDRPHPHAPSHPHRDRRLPRRSAETALAGARDARHSRPPTPRLLLKDAPPDAPRGHPAPAATCHVALATSAIAPYLH